MLLDLRSLWEGPAAPAVHSTIVVVRGGGGGIPENYRELAEYKPKKLSPRNWKGVRRINGEDSLILLGLGALDPAELMALEDIED